MMRVRPKKFILLLGLLAACAILFPVVRSNAGRLAPLLRTAGEHLALFSALSDLPDRSMLLLEHRYRDEIIVDPPADPAPHVPEPEPVPSASEPEPPVSSSEPEPASSASEPEPEAAKPTPPDIPAEYRGPMLEEDLSGHDNKNYLKLSPDGYLRNYTDLSLAEIESVLGTPPSVKVGDNSQPQVLIYHTHATEAFERYDSDTYDTRNNWRSTDNNMNMVAVGDALAKSLEEHGVNVIHDTTQHDYPSYNGAYDRSAATIASYLEQYPSIQVLLDVHRDAIDRDGTLVRPIATIDGKKAAQLMIIAPCDDGTMNIPDWRENLRFAASIQSRTELEYPGLMRPIFFCYRQYNFNKSPASLLMEFGSHGNTLEECQYTAQLVGKSIAEAIQSLAS